MRPVQSVTLVLEAGTPVTGLWCDACLRCSGIEVDVWSLQVTGLVRVGIRRRCTDCGSPRVDWPVD